MSNVQFGQRFSVYTPSGHSMRSNEYAPSSKVRALVNGFGGNGLFPVVLTDTARQSELEADGLAGTDHLDRQRIFSYAPAEGGRGRVQPSPSDVILTDKDAQEFRLHYDSLASVDQAAAEQYVQATVNAAKSADATIRLELNA